MMKAFYLSYNSIVKFLEVFVRFCEVGLQLGKIRHYVLHLKRREAHVSTFTQEDEKKKRRTFFYELQQFITECLLLIKLVGPIVGKFADWVIGHWVSRSFCQAVV